MTIELPQGVVSFAVIAAFLTLPAVAWWTWYLSRKVGQANLDLVKELRDMCAKSVDTTIKAANVSADVAKGILESTKPLLKVIEDMGGVVITRDPTNVMERMFNRLSVVGPDANGRAEHKYPPIPTAAAATQPDTKRPKGVKLPSEM